MKNMAGAFIVAAGAFIMSLSKGWLQAGAGLIVVIVGAIVLGKALKRSGEPGG